MWDLVRLDGAELDDDCLVDLIDSKCLVQVGKTTHGTHELYQERARITKPSIEEQEFVEVRVEADWPDACRVNRHVLGLIEDKTAPAALRDFWRFPPRMWCSSDFADFYTWPRSHNYSQARYETKVRFYGVGLRGLHAPIRMLISCLERVDKEAVDAARVRYGCVDNLDKVEGGPEHGPAVALRFTTPFEEEVENHLMDLYKRAGELLVRNGRVNEDEHFHGEQNARLVPNAEHYCRMTYRSDTSSCNLRDRHIVETLRVLATHLEEQLDRAGIVVGEPNSHVGDTRATSFCDIGEFHVGQLVREFLPDDSVLVSFTTDHGWVTSAINWGGVTEECKRVLPTPEGNSESRFHHEGIDRAIALTHRNVQELHRPLLERAIDVVCKPETELCSHRHRAALPDRFVVVMHIDQATEVSPLGLASVWDAGAGSEAYPMEL